MRNGYVIIPITTLLNLVDHKNPIQKPVEFLNGYRPRPQRPTLADERAEMDFWVMMTGALFHIRYLRLARTRPKMTMPISTMMPPIVRQVPITIPGVT